MIRGVRRASQLAALVDLLATDPRARANVPAATRRDDVGAEDPDSGRPRIARRHCGAVSTAVIVFGIVTGLHGTGAPISYPADDAIYPNGRKRDRDEIVRFMEKRVMPWARQALAPIVGSPDLVTCNTCHGADAGDAGWHMPAVAALPRPAVRAAGWENYGGAMDDQMRNAIYGYGAESDRASRAAYMREVVMPGMAQAARPSRLRFHAAVRLQPITLRVRVLSLPPG